MSYIGNTSTTQAFTPAVDYFSGNGSTTAFTLSRPVASVAQVQVVIDNVAQNPSSAYTISGSTITFTSAPLSGTNNIYVYYTSPVTQVIAPGQGTVNTTALGNITNIASGNSSLTLQTGSGNTTAVTIDTSQNVGIGVTPSAWGSGSTALQLGNGAIWKSGSRSVDWITNGYYNGTNYIYNTSNAATYYRQYDGQHIWANAPSGTAGNAITYTQAMTLDSSGNVGIGTSSPAKRLHVYKTGDGQTPVRFETSNASGNILDLYNDSNGWTLDSYGDLRLVTGRTSSGSPERLSISSTGRIGIATAPTAGNTLKVFNLSGDNAVQFGNPSTGVYLPNGGSSWSTYSDLRLKTVTGTYDSPLEDIVKINVIKFTWNYDAENKPQVGVSAQSVQLSVPEAIHQSTLPDDSEDKTEYLTVKYTELIPLMIASIQELKALVDAQATEIAELKAKVGV